MHPTGAATLPAAPEAEVQAMHSMDWLFKKERIYLLAQFWQQGTKVLRLPQQILGPFECQIVLLVLHSGPKPKTKH
ncbi:unnamed protein product [Plutella xylostella]|uniref:(diamondback moth) hypothetical protein n=1 Tax=Plutella xylostella TaxID=51655 RepID=A0A8S4DTC5_PLUXY|nr:unnamed protein product [Plutella xylostella]